MSRNAHGLPRRLPEMPSADPPGTVVPVENDALDPSERLLDWFRQDPMASSLGAELVECEPGRAVVTATVRDDQVNFLGVGHGGLLFTLGDIAMAFASNAYGRVALALRLDITFMSGVGPGDTLVATASTPKITRRFGHHQLDVHVNDELVARANGTTYRTDDWHFGSEAWPESWPHR